MRAIPCPSGSSNSWGPSEAELSDAYFVVALHGDGITRAEWTINESDGDGHGEDDEADSKGDVGELLDAMEAIAFAEAHQLRDQSVGSDHEIAETFANGVQTNTQQAGSPRKRRHRASGSLD